MASGARENASDAASLPLTGTGLELTRCLESHRQHSKACKEEHARKNMQAENPGN